MDQMQHRSIKLQDLAPRLMFDNDHTLEYLNERRIAWAKRWERWLSDQNSDSSDLEYFLARFDPSNYTITDLPDGFQQIEHRWPEHLKQRARERRPRIRIEMLALQLPH